MSRTKKTKKEPMLSTRYFVGAGGFAFVAVLSLISGASRLVSGNWFGAIADALFVAVLIYLAVGFFRDARKIKGMSRDETLIAAAIYERMKSGGAEGSVRVINISEDSDDPDHKEFIRQMTENSEGGKSESLEELRKARKGQNASD